MNERIRYDTKNAQSIGEFCPILNAKSIALTGATKNSVMTQTKVNIALPSTSKKMGINIRATMAIIITPRKTDTVFAIM